MPPPVSDSDSDDDEEQKKRFLESMDPNFMNDNMFSDDKSKKNDSRVPSKDPKDLPKSLRYPPPTENVFKSDLNVSEQTKKYIWQQLSEKINSSVEYVDVANEVTDDAAQERGASFGLKLFSDSDVVVNSPYLTQCHEERNIRKRRKLSPPPDLEKCKTVAVDEVFVKNETSTWSKRSKSEMYKYKEKNSQLYLVEPDNEFTKMRKKNNWSESKIKKQNKEKDNVKS